MIDGVGIIDGEEVKEHTQPLRYGLKQENGYYYLTVRAIRGIS